MSDNRRDQLIEFVEREFIGPDPIDWPGMTQSNGQEILASDPPRTRYIAGILYPAETTDDKADLKDDECELLDEADGEDVEVKPQKLGDGTVEFLEDAEELINRSNAYRQSAISITVSVKDGDAIRVAVSAGTYIKVPAMDPATGERLENKYKYPRTALAWENDNVPLILPTPTDGLKKFPIGTTGLQFDITYRYRTGDSRIYTFTLENTLRLLTAQQYERASAMICACDLIRKSHEDLFGRNRITIGLWVGSSTTPNKVSGAVKAYEKLYRGEGSNPFVMLKCPWCGAQMGPVQKGKNQWELPGYRKVPLGRRRFGFAFRCRNHQCDFSTEDLPLFVVDESIYEETPTLLLGTVDKFAMLPFRPNAQKIFGYENGVKKTSPDLIIQDELHLISGPLGSMVGHYETLIHELCTTRTASGDIHPKIIASTATISRAKEQCHALYGCDRDDVFQFPPSGLDAGNSFFAEEKRNQNGRRYVGILATGSSSDATTAIRLFASLLYGAKAMRVDSEKDRDPYWTNMGYYNSIRELGQAATWIRADIDQHLDVMYKRRFEDKRYPTKEEYRKNRRYIWRDEELTSRISGSEVTASLANLGIRYPGEVDSEGKIKEHPIDICLATNMISVGLDVSRLGLMTVAGQPKTTSEYIQATSRVGRDAENAPGLVFVLYRPGRPRDKSHYEQFRSYHSRVYCNVEPTSVTPFSAPVRERALHAIMVGMMRLESDDRFNEDPPRFPDDGLIDKVRNVIENRVDDIDSEELDATLDRMEYILQCWEDWNPRKWEPAKNPDWSYADPVPLMYSAGSHPNEAWGSRGIETPTSMRSVDASCEAEVLTNRYVPKEG